jgi:hypothetical protein
MSEQRRRWWPGAGLLARFDNGVLCAPTDAYPKARALHSGQRATCPQQHPAWSWLQAWCHDGLGTGRLPLFLPWRSPAVAQRLTVAVMVGWPDTPSLLPLPQLVQAFCCDIDGSDRLLAMPSGSQRVAWRVQIKLSESLWWRGADKQAPWDAGYLRSEMKAQPLLQHFRPRRPTLAVANCWTVPALAHLLRHWQRSSEGFDHAVRLLVLLPAASTPALSESDALWADCKLPVARYNPPQRAVALSAAAWRQDQASCI